MKLLSVGKRYIQLNIKSEKAASQLKWEGAKQLTKEEIEASQNALKAEEKEFREAFWSALRELDNFEEIEEILS